MSSQTTIDKIPTASSCNNERIFKMPSAIAFAFGMVRAATSSNRIKAKCPAMPQAGESNSGLPPTLVQIEVVPRAATKTRTEINKQLARIENLPDIDEKLVEIDKLSVELGILLLGNPQQANKVIPSNATGIALPTTSLQALSEARSRKRVPSCDYLFPSKKQAPAKNERDAVTPSGYKNASETAPVKRSLRPPISTLEIFDTTYPQNGLVMDSANPVKRRTLRR